LHANQRLDTTLLSSQRELFTGFHVTAAQLPGEERGKCRIKEGKLTVDKDHNPILKR